MTLSLFRKFQAFTMVELMISVSIMIILLASGSVAYLRYLNKQNLYQSGSAIEAMIKNARSKAQTGFLGNEEIGYCDRLNAVEIASSIDANSQVSLVARLHCADDSILAYESYEANNGIVLDHNFVISFLPLNGSRLSIGGTSMASGSATLAYDNGEVILNFDQGGNINVQYQ